MNGFEDVKTDAYSTQCPLCGGANQCGLAAEAQGTACWCRAVAFAPALLNSAPCASHRGACICRACAEKGLGGLSTDSSPGVSAV